MRRPRDEGEKAFRKLEKEVVFVYVPIDAYSEIINSGSFENFDSASQKSITEFYDYVRVYMEYEKKAEQLLNDLLIKSAEAKDIGTIKKPYEKILRVYYKYLGDKRIEIISKCDEVNSLLKLEIDRFS